MTISEFISKPFKEKREIINSPVSTNTVLFVERIKKAVSSKNIAPVLCFFPKKIEKEIVEFVKKAIEL